MQLLFGWRNCLFVCFAWAGAYRKKPPATPCRKSPGPTTSGALLTCWPDDPTLTAIRGLWHDDVQEPYVHLLWTFFHGIRVCSLFCGSRAGMFFSLFISSFYYFRFRTAKLQNHFYSTKYFLFLSPRTSANPPASSSESSREYSAFTPLTRARFSLDATDKRPPVSLLPDFLHLIIYMSEVRRPQPERIRSEDQAT